MLNGDINSKKASEHVLNIINSALKANDFHFYTDDEDEESTFIKFSHKSYEVHNEFELDLWYDDENPFFRLGYSFEDIDVEYMTAELLDLTSNFINCFLNSAQNIGFFSGVFYYSKITGFFDYSHCRHLHYQEVSEEAMIAVIFAFVQRVGQLYSLMEILKNNTYSYEKLKKFLNSNEQAFKIACLNQGNTESNEKNAQIAVENYCETLKKNGLLYDVTEHDGLVTIKSVYNNEKHDNREYKMLFTVHKTYNWYDINISFNIIKYNKVDVSAQLAEAKMSEQELFVQTMTYMFASINENIENGVFSMDFEKERAHYNYCATFLSEKTSQELFETLLFGKNGAIEITCNFN